MVACTRRVVAPATPVAVTSTVPEIAPFTAVAEIFDPGSGAWTPAGQLATERSQHTATLLNDGTVLVVGGRIDGSQVISTAEIYQ